ncbi:hypothetical protein UFOVP611_27 [uncultured Caudovirales phage]|uniref:Uncharacterized protein n=1 Tax=uncultured Caudovirales phage TaxID=2100421 RepID=A0A6J5N5T8_9CAUD|nr:hypothetical protein UFOVP611_27 [uncultured Caudovirales phage]
MTAKELSNINGATRELILNYLAKNDITLNMFATRAGVHQNQLWVYLYSGNEKKGLHSTTLQKIGLFMANGK